MDFVSAAVLGAGFALCTSLAALAYVGPDRLPPWLDRFLEWASGERVSGGATSAVVFFGACALAVLGAELVNLVRGFGLGWPRAALGVIVIVLEACWLVFLRGSLRVPESDKAQGAKGSRR